jgi:hypothetical protein
MTFGAFFSSVRRSMSDKMAAAARRGVIPPGGQSQPAAPAPATSNSTTRSASTQARPGPAARQQAERVKEDDGNYLIIDVRLQSTQRRSVQWRE